MPVMDEFKEERAALKNGTPKQKLTYFLDYYKWHTIFGAIALFSVISLIHQIVSHKETALYAVLLNSSTHDILDESGHSAAFAEYAGIDTDRYDVVYDSSVRIGMGSGTDFQSAQQLMVRIAAADLDVIVSDLDSLRQYAYLGDFYDLRDFLTREQTEMYAGSFYYVDRAVAEELAAAESARDYEYIPVYSDPLRPDEMRDPVPMGIVLPKDNPLMQDYTFLSEEPAVSVLINSKRLETTSEFIDFLMRQK